MDPWVQPEPGEWQHSSDGEIGGLWARRGHPPRSLVGIEFTGAVLTPSAGRWGYRRLPVSRDSRYAFVFAGVEEDLIGDFGLNLGSAAGYEMDAVQEWAWSDTFPEPVVLARATHPEFIHSTHVPIQPAADLALTVLPSGGAVFAVGSVTWTGSLSYNNYDNNVSRITGNVLQKFVSTPRNKKVC